jgi:hypothetical protein
MPEQKPLFRGRQARAACRQSFSRVVLLAAVIGGGCPGAAPAQAPAAPPQSGPQEAAPPDLINPDRPGIADGSQVIGPKRFQIETGYQNEFRKDAGSTERRIFVPTLLRFGISSRWEGRIEGNTYTFTRTTGPGVPGAAETDGFSPLSFGFKYHFQDQTAIGKRPSLGTIFRLFPASGSGAFTANHVTADLRLAADWDFTPTLSLNPNIGLGLYEDDQGRAFWTGLLAVTLNAYNRDKTINPFLDFGLQAPEERDGKSALILDAGVAFLVGRNVQLDLSAGTGIEGRTPPHPFLAGGVSVRF